MGGSRTLGRAEGGTAFVALLTFLLVVAPGGHAGAQTADVPLIAPGSEYAPGQVIVRYTPGVGNPDRDAIEEVVGAETERKLLLGRTELLDLDRGTPVGEALADLY